MNWTNEIKNGSVNGGSMKKRKKSMTRGGILRWSFLLVGITIAAGLITGCGQSESEADMANASDSTQTAQQLWTCGMHPDVISEEPGQCPICGMNLVPLKQGTADGMSMEEPMDHDMQHNLDASMQNEGHQMKSDSPELDQAKAMDMSATKSTSRSGEPKKILYWRAPMDPTFIRDKPGKSPMGMDLVPVYEGDETTTGGATVVIDPVTVQNIGVQTAVARRQRLSKVIRTVGHVDYNEESLNRINVKFSGWVEKLYVDETGQSIRKGQKLLDIYSPELVSTQQEYVLAVRNARKTAGSSVELISESGSSLAEASRRRLEYWDFTDEQIKDLETTGVVKKTVTLYAPVSGHVIMKMAEEGMRIMPGMDLYRIADLSKVWVYAHLYDEDIEWVKVGQNVTVELPYTPGKTLKGRVDYIYPYLDQKARDTKVRIVLDNPGLLLRPNMYANVELRNALPEPVVVIPGEAILRSGTRNVVFIDKGEGKFEPRDLVLGIEGNDGLVQVFAGVREGEKVVTSAQFLLDSESRLKEAIQKMLRERAKAASGVK